jgi:hypothetical protein
MPDSTSEVDPTRERGQATRETVDVGILGAGRDVGVAVAGLRAELLGDAELVRHRAPRLPRDEHAPESLALGLAQEGVDGRAARERLEPGDVLRRAADVMRPAGHVPGVDVDAERSGRG